MLTEADGQALCAFARARIAEALGGPRAVAPFLPELEALGATFVTLHRGEDLHGCIGSVEPRRSLVSDVGDNAVSAALHDPRATGIDLTDVPRLTVEVSVLSRLEPIYVESEEALRGSLRPGTDGLLLRFGGRRAAFLPQVWQSLPEPEEFICHLKMKAGLPADFWSEGLAAHRFTVEKFIDQPGGAAQSAIH